VYPKEGELLPWSKAVSTSYTLLHSRIFLEALGNALIKIIRHQWSLGDSPGDSNGQVSVGTSGPLQYSAP
jgi:hypothetical protein